MTNKVYSFWEQTLLRFLKTDEVSSETTKGTSIVNIPDKLSPASRELNRMKLYNKTHQKRMPVEWKQ